MLSGRSGPFRDASNPAQFCLDVSVHRHEGDDQIEVRIGNHVRTQVRPQAFACGDHVRVFARDRDGLNDLIRPEQRVLFFRFFRWAARRNQPTCQPRRQGLPRI
jgi:hypothetical protein